MAGEQLLSSHGKNNKISMTTKILIVDDERDIRGLIAGILEDDGYQALQAANADQAYQAVHKEKPDLVVLDIWLEDSAQDGLQILKQLKSDNPILPVIMISGHGTIETAVQAIKEGAYDFIEKPFKSDRLLMMVRHGLENAHLRNENIRLKEQQEPPPISKPQQNGLNILPDAIMDLSLKEARHYFERLYMEAQMQKFDGNISKTAAFIGMERSALHRKMKQLKDQAIIEIDPEEQTPDNEPQKIKAS